MPFDEKHGLRVLTLSGTPEQMGAEQGTVFREKIHTHMERFLRRGEELFGVPYPVLCRLSQQCIPMIPDPYLREMRAIAEASETSLENIVGLNCLVDIDAVHEASLSHCTNFVVRRSASADGRLIHGRNLEFPHAGILPEVAHVTVRRPSDESVRPTVAISWPGCVGFLTGYGAAQISVGEVSSPVTNATLNGIPFTLLLRSTLERCATLRECADYIDSQPRTCGYNLAFCSGREDDGLVCECTPSLVACRRLRKDCFVVAGACMTARASRNRPTLAADVFRHARLTQLLTERHGVIDIPESMRLLRDRYDPALGKAEGRSFNCICNPYTVHSVLFLPAEQKMLVAQGTTPAPLGTYHEYSMLEL